MDTDTDTVPVTGVDELEKHLDQLLADPAQPPTVKLFDDVELQLNQANTPPLIPRLLPKLIEILQQYQEDPAVLCSLAVRLLRPLAFTQVLSLASEESLVQALRSPAPSTNLLAMAVLEKATVSPGNAALVAMMTQFFAAFLTTWLSAPQVEVGEKGTKVLGDLLDADYKEPEPREGMQVAVRTKPNGQGMVWRRITLDRNTYGLFLSLASRHQNTDDGGLSKHQLTLAQGRLLRLMPRLAALDLATVTRTRFPDLHERYGGTASKDQGLLHFVALHMVDKEDDLMHLNLVAFFQTLVILQRTTPYSEFKMITLRKLMEEALEGDDRLRIAMTTLPDHMVPEEAEDMRNFIREIIQL
ncbi:hypothetical protein PG999_008353 [Apiospora kogelbergensis]|uniref:DNA mismatch repair protein HSM3 N-terminal domain-containing protein n=1 Tax=Apiospora kogelbergensis TaxID=1337665 RepID=A0AAW0QHQ6_9PEZI